MITALFFITATLVITLNLIRERRKYKTWEYRFFLKILRDSKKDGSFNESLHRICCVFPNFSNFFLIYYSRKNKREWKNYSHTLNELLNEIRKS